MPRLLVWMNLAAGMIIGFVATAAGQTPSFERDVLPILTANCLSCHGGTSIYTQAGLDLRTAASVLRGSHNGPVVVKGSPEESVLYQKVSTRAMPPAAFKLTLTDAQIQTIRKWIEAGALSERSRKKRPRNSMKNRSGSKRKCGRSWLLAVLLAMAGRIQRLGSIYVPWTPS